MNIYTIIKFGIIAIFIPYIVFGQKQEKIYLEKDNVVSNYYTVVYPDKSPYKGYMFLLPSTWETPEQLLFNTDLPMKAAQKGILTIIPVFKTGINHFGADNLTQESFKEILNDVVSKHKLQKIKFFVGGFSIGGTCAVKYAQLANKNDFNIKPAAVFVVDGPLDFEHFYNSAVRDVRLSADGTVEASHENIYMIGQIVGLMGGKPSTHLSNYHNISPYSFSDTTQSNIKNLLDTPLRIYVEPDINWWMKERGQDVSDMNVLSHSAMINELNRLGNEKAILITTENKGFRKLENGEVIRHPHSWSIVDNDELIMWLLKQ